MRGNNSPAEPNSGDPIIGQLQHDTRVIQLLAAMGFGCGLAILIVMWATRSLLNNYVVVFWALACSVFGVFLGFLFGIPRVVQHGSQSDTEQPKSKPESGGRFRTSYQIIVNTNLDDVSDWVTKIVVGVGLVELRKIPDLLQRLAFFIDPKQVPFIISVVVYFSMVGFLGGYLNTRMVVQRAFRLADLDASGAFDSGAARESSRHVAVSAHQASTGSAPIEHS